MLGQIFGSSVEHLAILITLHEKKTGRCKEQKQ